MILDPLDDIPVPLFRRHPQDIVQRHLERQVHSRARGNEPQRPDLPDVIHPFALLLPAPSSSRKQRALVSSSDGFTPAQQPAEPVRAIPRQERHRQLRSRGSLRWWDTFIANLRQPRSLARKLRVVENRIRRPVKLLTRRHLDPAALEHRPMERRSLGVSRDVNAGISARVRTGAFSEREVDRGV